MMAKTLWPAPMELQRQTLGMAMFDPVCALLVADFAPCMYDTALYVRIHHAIRGWCAQGEFCDPVRVWAALGDDAELEAAGGIKLLVDMALEIDAMPNVNQIICEGLHASVLAKLAWDETPRH